MTTDERLGTFEAILQGHTPEVAAVARALRKRIAALHPGAVETPRDGEGCTTYGVGPRKLTEAYAHIAPHTDSVNLGLYHGTELPDPQGLLAGTGKRSRHAKLRTLADVRSPAVTALIRAAVAERMRAEAR